MSNWPENELEAAVRIQQGRDYIAQKEEQARLEKLSGVVEQREEHLIQLQGAEKAKRFRKTFVVGPLAVAIAVASTSGYKHRPMETRVIDDVEIGALAVILPGMAEFYRRGFIKRSKNAAKQAFELNQQLGRAQDAWILETLGLAMPEASSDDA